MEKHQIENELSTRAFTVLRKLDLVPYPIPLDLDINKLKKTVRYLMQEVGLKPGCPGLNNFGIVTFAELHSWSINEIKVK